MKLTWFEARELRRFRDGIRIDDFAPGLNIFCGPNGIGKSSIIRAIRAAFFERYQTKKVTDLLPWSNPGARPTIEIHFEHDGTDYELQKRFLKSPSALLVSAGSRLENQQADDALAAVFGFSHAAKGLNNKPENLGVPGLLWIEQGEGQELSRPLTGAQHFLRDALGQSIGDLTSRSGDSVLDQLREQRDTLLAVNSGKPKGEFDKSIKALEQTQERIALLREARQRYREMVDRLAQLRTQVNRDEQDRPWESFEKQIAAVREATSQGVALENRRDNMLADQQRLAADRALVTSRLASFTDQQKTADQRGAALTAARTDLQDAGDESQQIEARVASAQAQLTEARNQFETACRQREATQLAGQLVTTENSAAATALQIKTANELQQRISDLTKRIAACTASPDMLAQLRTLQADEQLWRAKLAAAATQLSWQLEPGARVLLESERLSGRGERQLSRETRLDIPGHGQLSIRPGGENQQAASLEIERLESEIGRLLSVTGARSTSHLEQLLGEQQQAEQELRLLRQQLASVAPAGLSGLQDQYAAEQGQLDSLRVRREQIGGPKDARDDAGSDTELTTRYITQLQQGVDAAGQEFDRADQARQAGLTRLTTARATAAAAEAELAAARELLSQPGRNEMIAAEQSRATQFDSQLTGLTSQLANIAQQIARVNPQVLAQDIDRLTNSVQAAQAAYRDNCAQCRTLEGRLSEAGAAGTEEELALLQAQQERLTRRVAKTQRRADALCLLIDRLQSARRQATEQLQAPLREHLNHYLQLLFPESTLGLTDDLAPGQLQTAGDTMSASGQFDEQSFGTREQLGLVSRLAYADLLKAAGLPTLIILDDGLVHTDNERLARMKRILFDAASRHQILVFTCHEERWRDLGVGPRDIRMLPPAGDPSLFNSANAA